MVVVGVLVRVRVLTPGVMCRLWPDVARCDDPEGRRGADRPAAGEAGRHARRDCAVLGGVLVLSGTLKLWTRGVEDDARAALWLCEYYLLARLITVPSGFPPPRYPEPLLCPRFCDTRGPEVAFMQLSRLV